MPLWHRPPLPDLDRYFFLDNAHPGGSTGHRWAVGWMRGWWVGSRWADAPARTAAVSCRPPGLHDSEGLLPAMPRLPVPATTRRAMADLLVGLLRDTVLDTAARPAPPPGAQALPPLPPVPPPMLPGNWPPEQETCLLGVSAGCMAGGRVGW